MIVLHAHNHDRSEHHDLTDWVTRLEISLSTKEPWTTIDATLRLPHADQLYAPDPDDWLSAHEIPSGRAIAWGQVDRPQKPGLVREGNSLTGGSPRITASSWLSAMGKAQIYAMASQGVRTSAGTLFTLEEWSERFMTMMRLYNGKEVGPVLAKMVKMLGRLVLPSTMGGGQLGSSVAVAHNSSTAKRLGLLSPVDPIVGAAESIGDHVWPESTTALGLVAGLFWTNRELIEFFEVVTPFSREVLADGATTRGTAALVGALPIGAGVGRVLQAGVEMAVERALDLSLVPDSRLSVALRGIPALVYRLRPWRMEGLEEYLSGMGDASSLVRAAERFRDIMPPRTWPLEPDFRISWDEIRAIDPPNRPDRINAVTAEVPGIADPVQFWEDAGLPFADYTDIGRHGLRAMIARWPFIDVHDGDALTTTVMVAGMTAQMFLRQDRFLQGTLRLAHQRLDLQPGRVFEAEIPGQMAGSKRRFTAYIEGVRHSLTREGRSLVGRTDVTYSRGLYEEQEPNRRAMAPMQLVSGKLASAGPSFFDRAQEAPATDGILFRGAAIPWTGKHRIERRLRASNLPVADRTMRRLNKSIDILTLHFTGGVSEVVEPVLRVLDGSGGGAHFVVQPDGTLFQYLDLAQTAVHVGQDDMNRRSVGVEVMSPGAARSYSNINDVPVGPWKRVTGFWYGSRASFRSRWFNAATSAQEETLVDLMRFLSTHFAVPLAYPAFTGDRQYLRVPQLGHRCDEPKSDGGQDLPVTPGVWHHVELYNPPEGRSDAMGIVISDLIAKAGTP
ncbi:MAG TPA: N-acetylmuramoyl-L-alanine amidase [Myxococcota bacterium]|nr:N-acetylmuramoyl-L-alanine amidase [Myxococcota bacterium]